MPLTNEAITNVAGQIADNALQRARVELDQLDFSGPFCERLNRLLGQATQEFKLGQDFEAAARMTEGPDAIHAWSRATRAFTRSQVRVRQVINAVGPPATSSEVLFQVEKRHAQYELPKG